MKTFKNAMDQSCEVVESKQGFNLVKREYKAGKFTYDVYRNGKPTQAIGIGAKRKNEVFERVIKHAALYN